MVCIHGMLSRYAFTEPRSGPGRGVQWAREPQEAPCLHHHGGRHTSRYACLHNHRDRAHRDAKCLAVLLAGEHNAHDAERHQQQVGCTNLGRHLRSNRYADRYTDRYINLYA